MNANVKSNLDSNAQSYHGEEEMSTFISWP